MTSDQPPPPPTHSRSDHHHLLEGTLLHRSPKSNIYKKNIRMYTIFDMSGSAGASLEVGGIGSLQCYRFVNLKSKKEGDLAYSSTRFGNKGGEEGGSDVIGSGVKKKRRINNYEAQLVLNIPGQLPWVVMDVENDPTAFVVEISTAGFDPNDDIYGFDGIEEGGEELVDGGKKFVEAVVKEEEVEEQQLPSLLDKDDEEEDGDDDVCENDDGVFVFWGDDDEEEDDEEEEDNDKQLQKSTATTTTTMAHNQVQLDLSRAISKNKPYIRYAFKCPSRKNEKALWLAAFSKVGRLSDESKRKKTLFGKNSAVKNLSVTIVPTGQKNSRMRRTSSPNKAADLAKLASLDVSARSGGGGGSGLEVVGSATTTAAAMDESALLSSQKEYRVRPNYAYQHRWMTNAELTEEMLAPSSVMHDTRLSPTVATTNRRELGLMRVEVLQCRGLPQAKGKVNPNCVVYLVCGSYAFATDVIPQKVNPMWLRGMRRACALPVFHGYAVLMVGVFHDDGSKGSSAKDTFFGRVEVPIARLRSNNTYDVTLPLRESTSVYNRDKLGAVRLRFSLDYYDQRQFILSYAPSMRNKIGDRVCTTVACADPKSFRNIALTVHGTHLPDRFSTDMFKAAIRELTFIQAVSLRYGKQYVRDLMYWFRQAYRSSTVKSLELYPPIWLIPPQNLSLGSKFLYPPP